MNLQTALAQLDPQQEDHWTADGLPRMDVLHQLTNDSTIKRQDVTNLSPGLMRDTAVELDDDDDDLDEEEELEDEPEDVGEQPDYTDAPAAQPEEAAVFDPANDPVMSMDSRQVISDYDLTCRAMASIEVRHSKALARRKAAEDELAQLNAKSEILKRAMIEHERRTPSLRKTNPVKAYQESQLQERMRRVGNAQRFVTGQTSREDVSDVIDGRAPLDRALNARGKKSRPAPTRPLAGSRAAEVAEASR